MKASSPGKLVYVHTMPTTRHLVLGAGLAALLVSPACGDHALLQDGRALFNVHVEDTNTTWARPLRIRFKPASFGYDYDTNGVFAVTGHAAFYYVADHVSTATEVGKKGARALIQEMGWRNYQAPPPVLITPFTPAPPPTPTPAPVATPNPARVADPKLPMDERIQTQLNIFITEQQTLANQLSFMTAVKTIKAARRKELRLNLLRDQKQVLTQVYPADSDQVKKAQEALDHQLQTVESTGKYSWED